MEPRMSIQGKDGDMYVTQGPNQVRSDFLDVCKAILAIMVIAIHSTLFPNILMPWLYIAVPLYFLMSSYFFFYKKSPLKHFCARLLRLYFAWFLVLLPVIIYTKREKWFDGNICHSLLCIFKGFCFEDTFPASWFLSALLLSVCLVSILRRYLHASAIVLLSIIPFSMACLCSSWYSVFHHCAWLREINDLHEIFAYPPRSFTAALIWVAIGAFVADRRVYIGKIALYCATVCGAGLLYIEWLWAKSLNGCYSSGCYFSLPCLVVPLFLIAKDIKLSIGCARQLRVFSVVTYCIHYSVVITVWNIGKRFAFWDEFGMIRFCLAIVCSLIAYLIITKIEALKICRCVQYLH